MSAIPPPDLTKIKGEIRRSIQMAIAPYLGGKTDPETGIVQPMTGGDNTTKPWDVIEAAGDAAFEIIKDATDGGELLLAGQKI